MASARYTINIKPEDIVPDEKKELTKKEKAANFWLYHKWHVILISGAVFFVIWLIVSILSVVKPDYTIGIITSQSLPSETITELADNFELYAQDLNGDGEVLVNVCQYYINENDQLGNGGILQLQSDIQMGSSAIFLVNDIEFFYKDLGIFTYIDTPFENPTEAETDISKIAIPFSTLSAFNQMTFTSIDMLDDTLFNAKQVLADYSICLRKITGSAFDDDAEFTQYFNDCTALIDALK